MGAAGGSGAGTGARPWEAGEGGGGVGLEAEAGLTEAGGQGVPPLGEARGLLSSLPTP